MNLRCLGCVGCPGYLDSDECYNCSGCPGETMTWEEWEHEYIKEKENGINKE